MTAPSQPSMPSCWTGTPLRTWLAPTDSEAYLAKAETSATRAYLLDPQNALALAFYAEVLLDQQKWDQAQQYASQAVELAPNSMDAHRVLGTVLEGWGYYRDAIDEYIKASNITPNLTFLYLRIGLGLPPAGLQAKPAVYHCPGVLRESCHHQPAAGDQGPLSIHRHRQDLCPAG